MLDEKPEVAIKVAKLYISSGIVSTCLRQWNAFDDAERLLALSQENRLSGF